jgi:hypothetical protein
MGENLDMLRGSDLRCRFEQYLVDPGVSEARLVFPPSSFLDAHHTLRESTEMTTG